MAACVLGRLAQRNDGLPHGIRERRFGKGDKLLVQGEMATVFGVLKVGHAVIQRRGPDQCEHVLGMLSRKMLFGKSALLNQVNGFTFVATSAGRVCEIPVEVVKRLLAQQPQFHDLLIRDRMQVLELLADWTQIVRIRGLREQVSAALLLLSQQQGSHVVDLPSQAVLARVLNVRRESIQRGIKQLVAEGRIRRLGRSRIELVPGSLLAALQD